jgi:hypothetical protein
MLPLVFQESVMDGLHYFEYCAYQYIRIGERGKYLLISPDCYATLFLGFAL